MENNIKGRNPIKLMYLVIPTIAIALVSIIVLYFTGFFMTPTEKIQGTWERTRKGEYSKKEYLETYDFNSDGTGTKTVIDKDGYTAVSNFTWEITERKSMVINHHVKYSWDTNYEEYYTKSTKTAKKYWFVTKDQ